MGNIFVLEGPDYSGKTLLAYYLQTELDRLYPGRVTSYRVPGGTPVSEQIREVARQANVGLFPQALLYLNTMAINAESILKDLSEDKIVILDRWIWSTFAYQVSGLKNPKEVNAILTLAGVILETRKMDMIQCHVGLETLKKRKAEREGETPDRFDAFSDEQKQEIIDTYVRLSRSAVSFPEPGTRVFIDTDTVSVDEAKAIALGFAVRRITENQTK